MAESRIDPFDVGALERSVNDSAGRVSGIWLSFVVFSAYLAAAASMITHRQIFLEEPIKLPTINIDLPLVASAILLPLIFVIYHVFVLLQVVLLARTADTYNEAIEHNVTEEPDRVRIRQRLGNTLFAQLFAGSSRERQGVLGWLLRGMAWITLAIAPVGVLIVFEIKFLPYHSASVTWTHRGLIAFDLLAVLMLWASAVEPRQDIGWRSLIRYRTMTFVAAAVFVLSNFMITFPGEPGRLWTKMIPSDRSSSGTRECQTVMAVGMIVRPGFDRLVLLGEDFVDNEKLEKLISTAETNKQKLYDTERTRIFRGRDLRCARFDGADLRHVEFSESDLSGSILRGAHLEGAAFGGTILEGANLDNAQLQNSSFAARHTVEKGLDAAQLPNALLRRAQLQGANLNGVNLEGADLSGARLDQAFLQNSNLRGASLERSSLNSANLDGAILQGALISGSMSGAVFDLAQMQGSTFSDARMIGAFFRGAKMHGAHFYRTNMRGASFYRSELQGAQFREASFDGASFFQAQMQGVEFRGIPETKNAILNNTALWRAGNIDCKHSHVTDPIFEPVIQIDYPPPGEAGPSPRIQANDKEIGDFIARSLAGVPEAGRSPRYLTKDKLGEELNKRLRGPHPDSSAAGQAWTICANESQSRTGDDLEKLATYFVEYACRFLTSKEINPFATGIVTNWRSNELLETSVAKPFATKLQARDSTQCPNVNNLNEDTRKLIQEAAQRE